MGGLLAGLFRKGNSLPGLAEEALARNRGLIADKCGFFSLDVSLPAMTGASARQKIQAMVFHFLDETEPCPCGSGDNFGDCCRPLGPMRLFTVNPGGEGYSPLAFYGEVWEPCPVDRDSLHDALQRHRGFVIAADPSATSIIWNYLGEKAVTSGPGSLVFGTVELTSDYLKIEGASRVRYDTLRAKLEHALVAPLPSGKLEISYPDKDGSMISSGLLEDYRRLRQRLRELFSAAGREIMRDEYLSAAKALNMLRPGQTILFDDESDSSLLMDYGLFDLKRHGKTIIQHFMEKNPPAGEDDRLLYQGCAHPVVSIFQVEEIAAGALNLSDLLAPDRKIQLMDYNLSQCAVPGMILFTRLLPLSQFAMGSGGWGYVVDATQKEEMLSKYAAVVGNAAPRIQTAQGILLFKALAKPLVVSCTLP